MSEEQFKRERVYYTTLDCVLDTRLGCLLTYFPHLVQGEDIYKALYNYHTRLFDTFPGITVSEFRQAYLNRGKEVLKNSYPTNIKDELIRFAVHVRKEAVDMDEYVIPVLELNVYPYTITNKEELEKLEVALRVITCGQLNIRIVNIPIQDLTPKHCRDNYVVMSMYDYSEWLDHCVLKELFQKCPIPEITLAVPKVWFNDEVDPEAFTASRKGKTPEATLEVVASVFIGLQMVPVGLYSVAIPGDDNVIF